MRNVLVLLVAAALGMAGCSNTRADAPIGSSAGPPAAAGQELHGTVLDEERMPLAGAHVELLDSGESTRTDADGAFRLGPLDPGSFRLAVQKIGYAPAILQVEVPHEGPVTIALTAVRIDEASFAETAVLRGYIECAAGIGAAGHGVTYSGGCLNSPNHKFDFLWQPKEGLRTVLGELVWNATSTLNSATLDLSLHQGWSCDGTTCKSKQTWAEEGTSILRLRTDLPAPGAPVEPFRWAVDPPWRTELVPSVVVVMAQPFTLYATTAYGEQAPAELAVAQ